MNINKEIEEHWRINGDRLKFKKLESASYDVIRGNLTLYAYGRLRDWMDAEDAVQEAYVHALTYPPKGDHHNFGGLMKLWLDQSIIIVRERKNNRSSIEEEDDIETEQSGIDNSESNDLIPDQIFDIVGQTDLIMDMTDNLKPKQKNIIRLAMIFGYSYKEISGMMKVSPKTIDNTLTYFRQKVKEHPDYEDLRR